MEERSPWRRLLAGAVGVVVLAILASGWLTSSARPVEAFGSVRSILVVSDAGPVRVRSLPLVDEATLGELTEVLPGVGDEPATIDTSGVLVRSTQSWLLRRPVTETLERDGELVVRVTCQTRLPCRASVEIFVPVGVQLTVVAADSMVEVDSFDGALQVFAGEKGVELGSVTGSAGVVSDGPVRGSTLGPAEMTIQVVDGPVQLTYLDVPDLVAVTAVDAAVDIELPASTEYVVDVPSENSTVGVESGDGEEHRVFVRSDGRVVVEPTFTE